MAEDETIIRLDLRGLLERADFEVCAEARDGIEAVELAREHEPDFAIMDVMAKDGLGEAEAFARLRKASQVSGRPMKVIADALISTLGPQKGEPE